MAKDEFRAGAELAKDETGSALLPDPTIPGPSRLHLPALDGLRGVAILLVIVFHSFQGIPWSTQLNEQLAKIPMAGWCGVDVFFVLSGFLITGILLDSRLSPRYFRNFYARRFLRICPIYYLMLIVLFGIVPFFMPFDTPKLKVIWHNQLWIWTYLTNIGFVARNKVWANAGWFELNHLWSIAIEEQFYLIWPMVVCFSSRRTLKVICLLCVVGSPTLRFVLWHMHMRNGALYFPTPCRLDGLATGALIATLIRSRNGVASILGGAKALGAASIVLLVGLVIWRHGLAFDDSPTIVFGISLVNFLAASVLVLAIHSTPRNPIARVLSSSVLRTVGKYSYAMYLFHAPLEHPIRYLLPVPTLSRWVGSELLACSLFVAILTVVIFAAAFISWHLYEKHFLKLKRHFEYNRTA
jgi:peptidoglycan/LPS O-acetylase OafA/YrhL